MSILHVRLRTSKRVVTLSANSIAKSHHYQLPTLNIETCKAYLRQLCTPAPTDNKDKPTEHSNELTVTLLFGHTTCTYAYAESDGKIDRD